MSPEPVQNLPLDRDINMLMRNLNPKKARPCHCLPTHSSSTTSPANILQAQTLSQHLLQMSHIAMVSRYANTTAGRARSLVESETTFTAPLLGSNTLALTPALLTTS